MSALARSVLVTGSNRGIGLELVRQLAASPQPPQHIFATCRDPEGPRGKVSAGTGHGDGPEPGGRREFVVPARLLLGLALAGCSGTRGGGAPAGSHGPTSPAVMSVPDPAGWDEAGGADRVPVSSALAPGNADGWPTPLPCWDGRGRGAIRNPGAPFLLPHLLGTVPHSFPSESKATLSQLQLVWPGRRGGRPGGATSDI